MTMAGAAVEEGIALWYKLTVQGERFAVDEAQLMMVRSRLGRDTPNRKRKLGRNLKRKLGRKWKRKLETLKSRGRRNIESPQKARHGKCIMKRDLTKWPK